MTSTYSICDLNMGIFNDEVKIDASSPMAAAKKYLKPSKGHIVKRSDYGSIVITGPRFRKYVYTVVNA